MVDEGTCTGSGFEVANSPPVDRVDAGRPSADPTRPPNAAAPVVAGSVPRAGRSTPAGPSTPIGEATATGSTAGPSTGRRLTDGGNTLPAHRERPGDGWTGVPVDRRLADETAEASLVDRESAGDG